MQLGLCWTDPLVPLLLSDRSRPTRDTDLPVTWAPNQDGPTCPAFGAELSK